MLGHATEGWAIFDGYAFVILKGVHVQGIQIY